MAHLPNLLASQSETPMPQPNPLRRWWHAPWARLRRAWRRRAKSQRPVCRTAWCREGFYYLLVVAFVFLAAMIADMNLLMILAGMLAGPLWFGYRWVGLTLRDIAVARRLPPAVGAGDPLVVAVEVHNPRRRLGSWALVVEEPVERASSGEVVGRPVVFFPYVPAGQSRVRAYRGCIPQRGRYRFGPFRVSTRFPFGFFRRVLTVGSAQELTVYPRLGRLTQQWLRRHHESFEGAERREHRHGESLGDFYGVRPWRLGDSRRLIHWRSSARRGTLVVRQFEQQRNRDLAVLVDLWQPAQPQPSHLENVELAVSFAATIVAEACRRGGSDLIVATTSSPEKVLRGTASAALVREVMEALAIAEASPEDRLPALAENAFGRIDRGTEVVLVTTRPAGRGDGRALPDWLAGLASDPARRALLAQVRVVSTDSPQLDEYFQP